MSGTVIALGRLFAIYPDAPVLPVDNTILIRNKKNFNCIKKISDSSAKGRKEVTNHFVS
jgi:hypothetical protein